MKLATKWFLGIALVLSTLYPSIRADQNASVLEVKPGESIQAAIDQATAGDMIRVQPGTYDQAVTISKAITLVSADPENLPVLNGTGQANGIHIVGTVEAPVSGVVVRGFVVQKFRIGIRLENATNSVIENCKLIENGNRPMFNGNLDNGLVLSNADYNVIRNNTTTLSTHSGIKVQAGSDYNLILQNRCFNDGGVAGNGACGIEVQQASSYNRVLANTAIASGRGVLVSSGAKENIIKDNLFLDNQRAGIQVSEGTNPATGNLIADNIVLRSGSSGVAPAVDLSDAPPVNNIWRDNIFGTKDF
ncbi:MAG: right-handed parallel beta-helix repeat-containing protein [Acidobacteria bacterium]|nr:right-handed parallel beta-helix repeat-containing protein [Acidobacteriota bacterium]